MANSLLSGGLLGMGGFGGLSAQPTSLLGEFYDPKMARNAQMKNMLMGLGLGLMSEKGFGRGAELALAMGNQAQDDYRQMAMDAYRMKTAEEERAYRRQQDEEDKAFRQQQWDYNVGRQEKADAWTNTERQRQLDTWQQEDDMRAGQQNAVQDWTQNFESQGGNLFDPGMQSWLRGQGVQGVNPADTQRYNRMQPLMEAGMYPQAFGQMTAEPVAQEGFTLGKDQTRFDAYGNPIATGGGGTMQPDWKETTLEDGVYWIDQNNPQNRVKIGERPNRNEGEGREFTQEGKLRNEYVKESKPFTDLRINYQKIMASSRDNTGASDIAMVYSFMKMLDPTSVVREGEFATAENAGGVPTQIMTMYNRALTGERLAPEIRQQFLQQAARQYEQQLQTYQAVRQQFQELARQYGIDPERVAPDLAFGVQVLPNEADENGWITLPDGTRIRQRGQ